MLTLRGKVVQGAKRGRDLGFPTANIAVHKKIEEGIYLAKVTIFDSSKNRHPEQSEGSSSKDKILHSSTPEVKGPSTSGVRSYPALTFIGSAKTFNETQVKAESYLLGFSGDLYGQYITIHLLQKIRDNKKFASQEELVNQMQEDLIVARKFFLPWC